MTDGAAERLRGLIERWSAPSVSKSLQSMLDEALAAERRATVDRIRAALFDHDAVQDDGKYICGCEWSHDDIGAILDAEADR